MDRAGSILGSAARLAFSVARFTRVSAASTMLLLDRRTDAAAAAAGWFDSWREAAARALEFLS